MQREIEISEILKLVGLGICVENLLVVERILLGGGLMG